MLLLLLATQVMMPAIIPQPVLPRRKCLQIPLTILSSIAFNALLYSITVAASDSDNAFAGFSNYGRCVDIIAPVSIKCKNIFIKC